MASNQQFIEKIGRQRAMRRLGISEQAMSNAIKRGFPARWYAGFKELADEAGEECPPELFGMKGFKDTPTEAAE